MIKKYSCEHGLGKCFDCLEKHHIEETTKLVEYLNAITDCWGECCDGSRWSMLHLPPCPCKHHEALKYLKSLAEFQDE